MIVSMRLVIVAFSLALSAPAFGQIAPIIDVPPGWVPVAMKQCPPHSIDAVVPETMPCVPSPTKRCADKIVVLVEAACPEPGVPWPAMPQAATRLKVKGDPASWVPPSAYPRDALGSGIEGTVGFTLVVGPDGKPAQCRVTMSSGNDSLDWGACESLMRRAAFDPAKDANGQPIAASYSNRVRWVIPEGSRRPSLVALYRDGQTKPYSATVIMDVTVNADGSIASCEFDADRNTDRPDAVLKDEDRARECARPVKPLLDASGKPVKSRFRLTIETSGEIVGEEDTPAVNQKPAKPIRTRRPSA